MGDYEKCHENVNGNYESHFYDKERGWVTGIWESTSSNTPLDYEYTYGLTNGNITSITTEEYNDSFDDNVKITNQFNYTKGLLTKVTHNGSQYRYTYDGLGRIKNISVGAQNLMDISYTQEEGTTIQTIDYATQYVEEQKRFEIISDACGNPIMKKYNGEPLSTATYDVFGNPVQVVDKVKDKTYNYTYDRYGNVICVKETDNKTGSKVENTFDYPDGQLLNTKTYGATGQTYTMLYETDDAGHRYPDNVVVGVILQNKFTDKVTRDSFGRIERRTIETSNGGSILEQEYQYDTHDSSDTRYKNLVSCIDQDYTTLRYTYDRAENIKTVSDGNTLLAEYHYDALNRLVQEDNYQVNRKYTWNYDKGGNITSKVESVLSDTGNTCIACQTYTYRGSVWKDQLLSYNGTSIVYDEMGNPTTYKNQTLQWSNGRNLRRYGNNTFSYGADNIRYKKNNIVYTLDGNTILQETDGTKTIKYYYGNGGVIGFNYNGADYYYEKNLQGDVIALLDAHGDLVAEYVYDAWGKLLTMKNSSGNVISNNTSHIGYINPIRYRSYYYDVETSLYYLESRYYDPETGRFLNADSLSYLGDGSDLQNYNLYSYCENNPVMYCDPSGHSIDTVLDIFFLCLDFNNLLAGGWKDWKNWVGLGMDILFAVVPFATGGNQIVKLANFTDDISDFNKITVIGETMSRVETVSQFVNATDNLYDGYKSYKALAHSPKLGRTWGKIFAEIGGKASNIKWLYSKLRSGYKVIDIGIDIGRVSNDTGRLIRSSSYIAERIFLAIWEYRNVWKSLFHVF